MTPRWLIPRQWPRRPSRATSGAAGAAILTQPWLAGAELTETLELRRAQIETKYAAEIEALYA